MNRLILIAILITLASACTSLVSANERIIIGSKSYNEPIILGEMVAHLARHTGATAIHRAELGGTRIVYNALLKGELDFYFDYTGTLAKEIFAGQLIKNDDELRAALEKKGVRMGPPLGFNNSYALGMREASAAKLEIKTISDLRRRAEEYAEAAQLKFGVSDEFIHRNDGWPGLQARYQLPFVVRGMDHNLAYRGLQSGRLDVTDVYSTDAEVQFYKLRVLEDDLGYFPVYFCVPLYRIDLEERSPNALAEIGKLTGRISNAAMTAMNARVQIDRVGESVVAAEFINANLDVTVPVPKDNYWEKMANNLLRTTLQHLLLVSVSLATAIVIAVPLGIVAFRRPTIGHAILGAIGIVQTIPSLAVLVFMVPLLGLGALPAIAALFLYSLLPIVRNTYQGLKDISGNLRESATVLGLDDYAKLRLVEIPLASRSILNGIKTAAVINVGAATIGGLIGAGGYGQPIMTGLRLNDTALLLQGAIPAALLAVVIDAFFGYLERFFVPAGLRIKTGE